MVFLQNKKKCRLTRISQTLLAGQMFPTLLHIHITTTYYNNFLNRTTRSFTAICGSNTTPKIDFYDSSTDRTGTLYIKDGHVNGIFGDNAVITASRDTDVLDYRKCHYTTMCYEFVCAFSTFIRQKTCLEAKDLVFYDYIHYANNVFVRVSKIISLRHDGRRGGCRSLGLFVFNCVHTQFY